MMKRLGIFCFYDRMGVVDKYVEYLLQDISTNVEHLYIVCNGSLSEEGLRIFQRYTMDIYIRDNKGFDAGAYKDVLVNQIDFTELKKWKELLLINNSFYGPIYPFEEIFNKMASYQIDFWGLINHGSTKRWNIEAHIQSYFLVIREKMLHSEEFSQFWKSMKEVVTFEDAIRNFELKFTTFFENLGYKSKVFFDVAKWEHDQGFQAINWSGYEVKNLVQNKGVPIVKRKSLFLECTMGESNRELLDYIEQCTQYDVNLIWENMIRELNPQQVLEGLRLHFILDREGDNNTYRRKKVAVIIYLYNSLFLEECLAYLKSIPKFIDIHIVTRSEKVYSALNERISNGVAHCFLVLQKTYYEVTEVLLGMKEELCKYEYFCIVHNHIKDTNNDFHAIKVRFMSMWENLLCTSHYVEQALNLFEKYPKIGMLVKPNEKCSVYENALCTWGSDFYDTVELAKALGININNIELEYPSLTRQGAFWVRTISIENILAKEAEINMWFDELNVEGENKNRIIEKFLTYAIQSSGFAIGMIENKEFAENLLIVTEQFNRTKMNKELLTIKKYIANFDECYIYGCGEVAQYVTNTLSAMRKEVKGYIVTQPQEEAKVFKGKPVYGIYEMEVGENEGIIIGVGEQNTRFIKQILNERGIINYLAINEDYT